MGKRQPPSFSATSTAAQDHYTNEKDSDESQQHHEDKKRRKLTDHDRAVDRGSILEQNSKSIHHDHAARVHLEGNEEAVNEKENGREEDVQKEQAQNVEYAWAGRKDGLEAALPSWATADPVDGYIKHPTAGFIMHPSFYDNRRSLSVETDPSYVYDEEVDGPLCPPNQVCNHIRSCFEVRVRMGVMAHRIRNISFRDAEYIWRVSRSTIQRRNTLFEERSSLAFVTTPDHSDAARYCHAGNADGTQKL